MKQIPHWPFVGERGPNDARPVPTGEDDPGHLVVAQLGVGQFERGASPGRGLLGCEHENAGSVLAVGVGLGAAEPGAVHDQRRHLTAEDT